MGLDVTTFLPGTYHASFAPRQGAARGKKGAIPPSPSTESLAQLSPHGRHLIMFVE